MLHHKGRVIAIVVSRIELMCRPRSAWPRGPWLPSDSGHRRDPPVTADSLIIESAIDEALV
jgi:hypothetical protein